MMAKFEKSGLDIEPKGMKEGTAREERFDVKQQRSGKMAKGKASGGKSAGKQKIQAGPSGKMQKFTPVKPQKPGVSSVTNTGGGSYAKK